ncbi:hypothetical protein ACLOJK_024222 [Asimina triloba]
MSMMSAVAVVYCGRDTPMPTLSTCCRGWAAGMRARRWQQRSVYSTAGGICSVRMMGRTSVGSGVTKAEARRRRQRRAEATSMDGTGSVVDGTSGMVDGLDRPIQASLATETTLFGFYQNQRLDGFTRKNAWGRCCDDRCLDRS